MRNLGIKIVKIGLGMKIKWLPSLQLKFRKYPITINPLFFVGINLETSPDTTEKFGKLAYKDAALFHGAGMLANIVFGITLLSAAFLIGYCPKNQWFMIIAAASCAVISVLIIFSKIFCAYVLPLLGPIAAGLLSYYTFCAFIIHHNAVTTTTAHAAGTSAPDYGNIVVWLIIGGFFSIFLIVLNAFPIPFTDVTDETKILKLAWKKLRAWHQTRTPRF